MKLLSTVAFNTQIIFTKYIFASIVDEERHLSTGLETLELKDMALPMESIKTLDLFSAPL